MTAPVLGAPLFDMLNRMTSSDKGIGPASTGDGEGLASCPSGPLPAPVPCSECKGTRLGVTSISSPTLKWCPKCRGTGKEGTA